LIVDIDEIKNVVNLLVSKDRLLHVEGTAKFAKTLARVHGLDENIAEFIGYAHDIFRDINQRKLLKLARGYNLSLTDEEKLHPILLHGKLAAEFLRFRFNVEDEELLDAVRYHTSGYKNFGIYGKLLFLADSLEETRNYPNVNKLREIAFKDIEMGYFEVLRNKLIYAIERNLFILKESIESWNELIRKRKGGSI
jgi:predicted HD superfamily hydrolase involved in NAD metabolism